MLKYLATYGGGEENLTFDNIEDDRIQEVYIDTNGRKSKYAANTNQ